MARKKVTVYGKMYSEMYYYYWTLFAVVIIFVTKVSLTTNHITTAIQVSHLAVGTRVTPSSRIHGTSVTRR